MGLQSALMSGSKLANRSGKGWVMESGPQWDLAWARAMGSLLVPEYTQPLHSLAIARNQRTGL